jgi:hypothetical protein
MSANTPESIPTSKDRSSHRPTKRRALTPVSQQAATVSSLFARPDQEIRLPPPVSGDGGSSSVVARRAVPEIVTNVQGSSAGAGSGEFHVYKASRRREYERLRAMDEEVVREKEQEDFEKAKREREERDAEKTRRNRERRERKKGNGKAKGQAKVTPGGKGTGGGVQPRTGGEDGNSGAAGERGKGGDGQEDAAGVREGQQAAGANGASSGPGLVIHDDD